MEAPGWSHVENMRGRQGDEVGFGGGRNGEETRKRVQAGVTEVREAEENEAMQIEWAAPHGRGAEGGGGGGGGEETTKRCGRRQARGKVGWTWLSSTQQLRGGTGSTPFARPSPHQTECAAEPCCHGCQRLRGDSRAGCSINAI